jgi:hypothetical protein
MPQPIDAHLVQARMRDLGQTTVSQTISLFKGGIFALAAVVLLEIVTQPDGRLMLLMLWSASFCLALTSYNAWLNATVIDFRESVGGIVLIIAQMMAELMLFATLTPRFAEQAWRGWALVYGIFMVVTAARVLFFPMNRSVVVDAGLRPMLDALKAGGRAAAWRLMAFGALAWIFAAPILLLPKDSPWPQWLTMAFSVFVAATSLLGLMAMHSERIQMERLLRDALDVEEAKLPV